MNSLFSTRINLIALIGFFMAATLFIGCSDDGSDDNFVLNSDFCLVEINGQFEDVALDKNPEYLDGGDDGYLQAFYDIIKYPAEARQAGVEGVSIVHYEITVDGTVENILMIQDPGAGLGEETIEVLMQATEGISFSPGILNNNPVRVMKELRITYKLQ